MSNFIQGAAIALVATAFAGIASAATVPISLAANDTAGDNVEIVPGDDFSFVFTATEDLQVSSISVSATGASGGVDLGNIRFGYAGNVTNSLLVSVDMGGGAAGLGFLPSTPFILLATQSFTVVVDEAVDGANSDDVQFTISATTADVPAPSAVPLPASGLLLLGALGVGGMIRRSRRS